MTPKISLEELLKPDIWTCGKCGGPLYVHPYLCEHEVRGREKAWREIKSINWCPNCSPKKN